MSEVDIQKLLINAICLFLLIFSYIQIRRNRRVSFPLVKGFILANVCAVLFSVASVVFSNQNTFNNAALLYFIENGYNCSAIFATGCWFLNSLQITGNRLFEKKGFLMFLMLPLGVCVFLSLTTGLHHKIFWISEAYQYMRGKWFIPFFVVPGLYLASAFGFYLYAELNKEIYVYKNLNMLAAGYTLFLLICMGIQNETRGALSLINVSCAVTALLIHEDLQRKEVTLDSLTGLNNRNALNEYMIRILKSQKKGQAILLDVDLFKQINDRYGHLEGDKALITVADALRLLFGSTGFPGRLGGDEFLILTENSEQKEELVQAEGKINDCIKDLLKKQNSNYTVTVSAGCAEIDETMTSIPDILKVVDERLYSRKHEKRIKAR